MKGFVRWLLTRRYRPVILAAAFAPAFPISFISTALMTLETLHRGGREGLMSAGAAIAGVLVLAWMWGADPWGFALTGGVALLSGVGLGMLLRWAGSLALAFQGAFAVFLTGAVLVALLWPEPGTLAVLFAEEFRNWLASLGVPAEQVQAGTEGLERVMTGFMIAVVFIVSVGGFFLGGWWAALTRQEPQFGAQFRELRLGRYLGIPGTLLMALNLVWQGALIQNLFPLVLIGFWFQGIAVVHAWGHARQWNRAFIAAMYILLLPPVTGALTLLALASVGLLDNWIELRAPLRAKT